MATFGIAMLAFVVLLFIGMPIAISIGMTTAFALFLSDIPVSFIAQLSFSALDSFTYLAIPMFIMAGFVMETGGLSRRIVNFASSLVGRTAGGLGIVTVVACMFFAAISGSSPATVAAIGSMMVPSMIEKGYNRHFAGALTASAGSLGILIPPSIPMIIYAVTAEISIGDMFLAGFIPGAMIGTGLILVVYWISKRRGYKGQDEDFSLQQVKTTLKEAKWALLTPIIILGGIYSGIFTATEAACITVIYTLIISLFVHKEMKFSDLRPVIVKAALTTGCVIIILGFATAFARYLTISQIPQMIGELILSYTNNATLILMIFVVLIMFTGLFIETAAQILIYTPLFLPILVQLGVSPYHFGIILIVGTELGLITPPVGVNLFVAKGITGSSMVQLSRAIVPFLLSMLLVQFSLVLLPEVITFLPNLFG
ncbi:MULTISPECIES: TRAP transporter large permease [Aliivibrio]|uniref:TRAP transporter large permease protein n=2 Tax=Aliivibrio fischeri TaxID=668 RepID=B5ESA7_ALIFM|nr:MULTISPECIES: TRAP transporter large permease [Aliivibrio]ACH63559.1 trap-type c4-dicarboxylate transport system, large permease component [Aliivibrio fischeri MJ11]EHN68727.1 trap-type c4-dicarboxylate transport system, large permease component [Aliivibrio fischeri SR5]MBD1570025.1 TRAP transporter large permease [Aliivibrio sp. S10_S31]MUJ25491.1 TRAP transporter large permease subunit [Aliivibrio fischeri]MUK25099.1 TRAP transporter large permease subunit [Aliivibrio fischeri]